MGLALILAVSAYFWAGAFWLLKRDQRRRG